MKRQFDEHWDDWKVGDEIVWKDYQDGETFVITGFKTSIHWIGRYVQWNDPRGGTLQETRDTNLLRVRMVE